MARLSNTKKEAILKDLKAKRIGVQKIAEKYDVTVYTVKKMKAEMLGKPIPKPTPHLEPKKTTAKKPTVKAPEPKIVEVTEKDLEPWDKYLAQIHEDDYKSAKLVAWVVVAIIVVLIGLGLLAVFSIK